MSPNQSNPGQNNPGHINSGRINPIEHPASPDAGLTAENAAWIALLGTLADEERALVEGDADRLASLNIVKLERLHATSDLTRTRLDTLRAAGFAADAAGMEAWLTRHGTPATRTDWQSLRALEDEARACNQRVGKLIEMRLAATRQSLNVLMHAATGRNGLYDQAGQAVAARASKPLTAA